MKKFSRVYENCVTDDVNQGNALSTTGVTNHYTPVQNILTNIKNLFCAQLSIAAAVAEDGVSIKLHSHKFVTEKDAEAVLSEPIYNGINLKTYIQQQGLDKCTAINHGQYFTVVFSPSDVKVAEPQKVAAPQNEPVKENVEDVEYVNLFINEGDDADTELEDESKEKINKLIKSKDKVKAAKELGALVSKQIELPKEYYFAGVKDVDGKESIALRWKYTKRRPHGKKVEATRSLMNIYGEGADAVWVQDFDKKTIVDLPDEVRKLIDNVLDLLNAKKSDDECVYTIGDVEKTSDGKEKDDDNKEKKNLMNGNNLYDDGKAPIVGDDDEVEDDPSRNENDN